MHRLIASLFGVTLLLSYGSHGLAHEAYNSYGHSHSDSNNRSHSDSHSHVYNNSYNKTHKNKHNSKKLYYAAPTIKHTGIKLSKHKHHGNKGRHYKNKHYHRHYSGYHQGHWHEGQHYHSSDHRYCQQRQGSYGNHQPAYISYGNSSYSVTHYYRPKHYGKQKKPKFKVVLGF